MRFSNCSTRASIAAFRGRGQRGVGQISGWVVGVSSAQAGAIVIAVMISDITTRLERAKAADIRWFPLNIGTARADPGADRTRHRMTAVVTAGQCYDSPMTSGMTNRWPIRLKASCSPALSSGSRCRRIIPSRLSGALGALVLAARSVEFSGL